MITHKILEGIGDAIYGLAPDWTVTFFNRQAELFSGRSHTDIVGRCFWDVFPAAIGSDLELSLRAVMQGRVPQDLALLSPSTERWTDARMFPLDDGGIAVSWRDITRQKAQEAELAVAIEAQDLLFREMTHRVANNFSQIAAMLSLQAREVTEPAARAMWTRMADSVQCMGLVHRRLYRGRESLGDQDLGDYLAGLALDLKASLLPADVELSTTTQSGMLVSAEVATTVGMMVAELVMNSRKHAWRAGQGGQIFLALRRDGDMIEVEVRDDGRGVAPGLDPPQAAGLGLRLLRRQIAGLKGTFTPIDFTGGAMFLLRFPLPASE